MSKTYRVFVTRHFIKATFYDIEADSIRKARTIAKKAAYALEKNVRESATDNGWIPDEGIEIASIGDCKTHQMKMKEVYRFGTGRAFEPV